MCCGSIRKAADDMNITASALNRRIQRFEEEFGSQIFERLPGGMRLNPAGEILIQHIRRQFADLAGVQSQVADLAGERLGTVSLACSQALMPYFLPTQIAQYRRQHPGVQFTVNVRDRAAAEQDLARYACDLALVFEPAHMVNFEVLFVAAQPVNVIMASDHPLAHADELRLRDCLQYDCILPSQQYGVRHLLERSLRAKRMPLYPIVESESFDFMRHYVLHEQAISFQIPIAIDTDNSGLVLIPLSEKDVPVGRLYLGRLRGRTLPVAAARFANQLARAMQDSYEEITEQ